MAADPVAFDAGAPWRVHPEVSLRDEEFGALAYHHGSRRLVFLTSAPLAEVVRQLEHFDSARSAVNAMVAPADRDRYVRALAALAVGGILCGR